MGLRLFHGQCLAGFPLPVFQGVTIHPPEPQRMDILLWLTGSLLCSHAGLPGFSRELLTVQRLAAVADAYSHGMLSAAESCFMSLAESVCMSAAALLGEC